MSDPFEQDMQQRGQAVRAIIHQTDDTGSEQLLTIETHSDVVRDQVPVHFPYGFASHAPADGAVTVVVATGGDQGEQVALPPSNPQAARFGNMAEGEACLYDASGQRVHLRNGTIVAIYAGAEMQVTVNGVLVLDLTSTQATLNVPLKVNGGIVATGDVVGKGVSLAGHTHPGVQQGQQSTQPPSKSS